LRTALITGGSGGIGLALAREFSRDGWNLVLVARDEARLRAVGNELKADWIVADLAAPGATEVLFQETTERGIVIDALVNNAGFGLYGEFVNSDATAQLGMIDLNVAALTSLTRLYLPGMVQRGSGRVLNVSSTAAFQPGPLMAVYYATKAYVNSFSEALAVELDGTGVTVTTLCPAATATEFAKRAEMGPSRLFRGPLASAEEVARVGYRAMMLGQGIAVVGGPAKLFATVAKLLPTRIAARVAKRAQDRVS